MHRQNVRLAFELRRKETRPEQVAEFVRDGETILHIVEALNALPPDQQKLIDFWNDGVNNNRKHQP